ncbi:hypothetical protein KIN20_000392 [Parelaphostrongylus tenuis]|uniref:Uncharacterized protein n=1 Tax=Parelaphostrongylus tenuis TaxID=148309 RepID=A0AAD5LS41_PARTN|nr:hypothetical protein KIN20_000392 [Parelaphostrongylus tenuis]
MLESNDWSLDKPCILVALWKLDRRLNMCLCQTLTGVELSEQGLAEKYNYKVEVKFINHKKHYARREVLEKETKLVVHKNKCKGLNFHLKQKIKRIQGTDKYFVVWYITETSWRINIRAGKKDHIENFFNRSPHCTCASSRNQMTKAMKMRIDVITTLQKGWENFS